MAESKLPEPTTEDILGTRFATAATSQPPSAEQKRAVEQLREAIIHVASHIEAHVPHGRNKSLALTALEDVQMRANRGIFATGPSA